MTESGYYDDYWARGVHGWQPEAGLSAAMRSTLEEACRGQVVLDYGGGDGRRYGDLLRAVCARYVVADVSTAVIESRRRLGDEALLVGHLAAAEIQFDAVVMLEVLEHLLDPMNAVTLAASLVRPGGRAVISVPNAFSWWNRARMVGGRLPASGVGPPGVRGRTYTAPHVRFFELQSFTNLLEEGGFAVERMWSDGLDLGPISGRARARRMWVTPRRSLLAATYVAECRRW